MCLPFAPDAAEPNLRHWSPISPRETCCTCSSLPFRLFAGRCAGPPVAAAYLTLAMLMQGKFCHFDSLFNATNQKMKPASSG